MNKKRRIQIAVFLFVLAVVGITTWYTLYRDVPQPAWITADQHSDFDFFYGSVGAEGSAGLPYWIWLALPRMFPEHLPGPGGYASLGRPWEEGREMPVGFSKKTIGYVRVAANCSLCHVASYRTGPDEVPRVVAVAAAHPGHTANVRRLLAFFEKCAQDPRFNADDILAEIDMATRLSLLDRLLYRRLLIPRTRQAILDGSSVFVDTALRLHSTDPRAATPFAQQRWNFFEAWMKELKAPPYPLPVDAALAAAGKPVFAQHCGSCHSMDGTGKGTEIVLLDGVWLRGPYLHNGSVPTVRDLLEPEARRPRTFYSGNDLIDSRNVGFVSTLAHEMGRQFPPYDTTAPGNSNSGHLYGTSLSGSEKDALLEYLKTL